MIDYANPRVSDVAMYLKAARAAIGKGRFTISIGDGSDEHDFYLSHWYHPTAHAFLENKIIAKGTVEACLRSLPQYILDFPADTSLEDLASLEEMIAKLGRKETDAKEKP